MQRRPKDLLYRETGPMFKVALQKFAKLPHKLQLIKK